MDLQNIRLCSSGNSSQNGKQQNIMTEKDSQGTLVSVSNMKKRSNYLYHACFVF